MKERGKSKQEKKKEMAKSMNRERKSGGEGGE